MIFHSLRTILFHPGKTAGTSFERWLEPERQRDPYIADRATLFGWDPEFGVFLQHATCQLTRRLVGEERFDAFFKFVIVRDPFARLASVYGYNRAQLHQEGCSTFRDFVLSLETRLENPAVENGLHVCPQVAYAYTDGRMALDYVGRFEDLPAAAERIRQQLGLADPLPHLNQSAGSVAMARAQPYQYDPEMVAVIQTVYAADFEAFGYPTTPEADLLPRSALKTVDARASNEMEARIFVQIPSYRDRECQFTIKDLFEKATQPERVAVGVCWQFDPDADQACFQVPVQRPNQVRTLKFHYREAQGLGWARQQAQKLFRGEEYTLQIDAHMRFERGWDESLIRMLKQCAGEKNILSHYPPSFVPPDRYQLESIPYMYPGRINDAGIPMEKSFTFNTAIAPPAPIPNYFVAGGMIFAPSQLFSEVPPDPHVYFWGEQISTALRAWTRGWDIYSPNQNTMYHIYHESTDRPLNWNDNPEWVARTRTTAARMQYLLGISDSLPLEFAQDRHLLELGSARSLTEYQTAAGINFRERRVASSMMPGVIARLRRSGVEVSSETAEWYESLMLIDDINYQADISWIELACRKFCESAQVAQHRYAVCLHAARRYLDAHEQPKALEFAVDALKISPFQSNAPSMIARIFLRQAKYLPALAYAELAENLIDSSEFRPVVFKEPHPLTIQALAWCKYQKPDRAVEVARRAKQHETNFAAELDTILGSPADPIAKEHWLFPDKKANFALYRAKNEIASEWINWVETNLKGGASKRALEITLLDIGFAPALVQGLLGKQS